MLTSMTKLARAIVLGGAIVVLLPAHEVPTNARGEGFRIAAKRAVSAVVSVLASKTVSISQEDLEPLWNVFGKNFNLPQRHQEQELGSGVVVSADGYILTNEHVIADATSIRIVYSDGREYKARRMGADVGTDIAVLKIDATDLPFLDLADSSQIDVGDIVLAIGNPFGIGGTVTMGIVSALARRGVVDAEPYEGFIQTDAAINPGNSGGALVTSQGELIGISTAIVSQTGGSEGIGFAVPANVARQTMAEILAHGRVIRGWLGISVQPVHVAEARAFGLKGPTGVLINAVDSGSPAAEAGIVRGEIVLEFDAQRLSDPTDLRMKVARTAPNSNVRLKLYRDGKERIVSVTTGELVEEAAETSLPDEEPPGIDGLDLEQITPRIARELGLPMSTAAVVVYYVAPDSSAANAGLQVGDVIVEVGRCQALSVPIVERALRNRGSQPVVLLVTRSGKSIYVVIDNR